MEKIKIFSLHLLFQSHDSRRSFCAWVSLLMLCLLAYNSVTMFSARIPFPAKESPEFTSFSPENTSGKSRKVFSLHSKADLSFSFSTSVEEGEVSGFKLKTHMPLLHKDRVLAVNSSRNTVYQPKRSRKHRRITTNRFEERVMKFFSLSSSNSPCKFRFFMTWIASVESFGDTELFAVSSLFKTHPNGCLVIASNSLDSKAGIQILRPFTDKGFKVTAISPDFNYLFENTEAQSWYNQLMQGNVSTGEVSLGQNLSNLLRLGLLYRFGGVYLDTDVIVLNSLEKLRNTIGAQTIDLNTGNWSRLNNAVMIFDKGHPLVYKFIQEFALTFDGNKWGHNGPYLVSRVVARVRERPRYNNVNILSPMAFYPVDWSKIKSLFEGPRDLNHSKWLIAKLRQIQSQSYAVHLWNKQSKGYEVEKGSIISHIMLSSGFNSSNATGSRS